MSTSRPRDSAPHVRHALPGAGGCAGAVAHGEHAGVGGGPKAGPALVGLEHGQTRRRIVRIGCGHKKAALVGQAGFQECQDAAKH